MLPGMVDAEVQVLGSAELRCHRAGVNDKTGNRASCLEHESLVGSIQISPDEWSYTVCQACPSSMWSHVLYGVLQEF